MLEPTTKHTLVAVHLAASVAPSVHSSGFYPVDLQEVLPDHFNKWVGFTPTEYLAQISSPTE